MGACTSGQAAKIELKNDATGWTNLINDRSLEGDLDSTLKPFLYNNLEPNRKDNIGMTPLHVASECGKTTQCQILLYIGADVNLAANITGCRPLIFAASNGHTDCVKLLLDAGADVNGTDIWHNTALFKACVYNHLDTVKLLLENGASPDLANKWGALPLQYAAQQGHHQVVQALIDHGADLYLHLEHTVLPPLSAAASRSHHQTVEVLLKAGIPINYSIKNDGKTALYHSMRVSCEDTTKMQCIRRLLSAGATVTEPCIKELVAHDYSLYQTVLQALPASSHHKHLLKELLFLPLLNIANKDPGLDVIKLLYSLGFYISSQELNDLVKEKSESKILTNYPDNLNQISKNPRSLKSFCRLQIRGTLHPNVSVCVDKLPLPGLMKDYVAVRTMQHLDDISPSYLP